MLTANPEQDTRTIRPSRTRAAQTGEDDETVDGGCFRAVTGTTAQNAVGKKYFICDSLGRGGMGEVFLAEQQLLGRMVAMKVVHQDQSEEKNISESFVNEAQITARLAHPNIIPIYDAGSDYLVLKRIIGTDLYDWMDDHREDDNYISQCLAILIKITLALNHAHKHGIIHRDIKPGNIMVGEYGEVLVMDWGIAVRHDEQSSIPAPLLNDLTAAAGTPSYMAPEMARAEQHRIGPASDIFLVGSLLYRMLTGHAPFTSFTFADMIHAAAHNTYPPLQEAHEDIPAHLITLQQQIMHSDPAQRGSMEKLTRQLQRARSNISRHKRSTELRNQARKAQQQAEETNDEQACYALLEQSLSCYHQAVALCHKNKPLQQECEQAECAFVRRVANDGNVELANAILPSLPNTANKHSLQEYCSAAREKRINQHKRVRRIQWGLSILVGAVICVSSGFMWYMRATDTRLRKHRSAEVSDILEHTPNMSYIIDMDDPSNGFEIRLQAGRRALGLDPHSERIHEFLAETCAAYATWTCDNALYEQATLHTHAAERYGAPTTLCQQLRTMIEQAALNAGHAPLQKRIDTYFTLCDTQTDGTEQALLTILQWPHDDVEEALTVFLEKGRQRQLCVAAAIIARRLDISTEQFLEPLETNVWEAVREAAQRARLWRATGRSLRQTYGALYEE